MPQNEPGVSAPSEQSKWEALVGRMPRPDPEDKILKDVKEGEVEQIVAELHSGGHAAVVGLVNLLVEPGGEKTDSPVRHALHALVIGAGGLGDEQRRALSVALASTLDDASRPISARAFVVRQMQLCGGAEASPALGKLLRDEDLYSDAAMALLAIRAGAAAQFRAALPDVTGPQRVAAIQALGALKDAESIEPLRRAAARDADPVARLSAVWALANIGDAGSVETVLKAADESTGTDRTRATDACLLLAESLAAAGRKDGAAKIYRHLHATRTGPAETYVRGVAARALGE
jgi:HEAT repeat protein